MTGIHQVVDAYAPNESVIEKVFVNINPQSTLLLGQARVAQRLAHWFEEFTRARVHRVATEKSRGRTR